jgi:cytochrome c oxidase subunit IV
LAENLALGPLAPFAMAVPCFMVCFFVVLMTWEENYGDSVSQHFFTMSQHFSLFRTQWM